MLNVTLCLLSGIVLGLFLRKKTRALTIIDRITPGIVFILLFFFGLSLGINEKAFSNITSVGVQAFLISIGGILGSVGLSLIVYHYFLKESR